MSSNLSARVITGTLVLAVIVGGELAAEHLMRQRALDQEHGRVQEYIGTLRARIEGVIYRDLLAVTALSSYIAVHPQLDQAQFAAYAGALMAPASTLRHLAAAPGLVIHHIHPLAGNETVVGLDYRDVPAQRLAALKVVDSRSTVLAGPVALVQGGHGFIARSPVYPLSAPDRLWGIVAAVMDRDTFYREAGLLALEPGLAVALRGADGLGDAGSVFFGPAALFAGDAERTVVNLPHGQWILAARPRAGWGAQPPATLWSVRLGTLALLALLTTFVALRARDRSDTFAARQAMSQSEASFRSLFDSANDAVFINQLPDLRILDVNQQAERYLGYSREALLALTVEDIYLDCSPQSLAAVCERVMSAGSAIFEARHRHADGHAVAVEISTRLLRRDSGDLLISVVRDISERNRIQQALQRSQQDLINAIESLPEGFALWDRDDRLQVYNRRFVELMPELDDCIHVGMSFTQLARLLAQHGGLVDGADREAWVASRIQRHCAADSLFEMRTDGGRHLQISERRTPDGYIVGLYADITDIRQAEAHIRYRADFDPLTDLPNRENFMNQLAATIRLSRRAGTSFALMFIDLDRFKNINDTMGHETGDLLLQEAARRICESVRQTDTVARFGGDEFTVILRDIEDPLNAARSAEVIIARLAGGYQLHGHIAHTGASIGITVHPADAGDEQTLLRNADMAMYQAKAKGRNTYQFFTAQMSHRAERFVAVEKDLRRSIGTAEFDFHYQPVFRLSDGALAGAEALLRWQHPERGPVSPAEFIPVAEETRLIVELGAWGLRHACHTAQAWCNARGKRLPRLAINVSSRQFWGGFDGDFVREVLSETGFPPACLLFEMTESLLIDEDHRVLSILEDFREMGIGIAIDDFGTGYSALGYLRRFPVTMLKIDRSFVHDIENDVGDTHVVESIIALGQALRLTVVAEGVESAGQAEILRKLGCDFVQGYFYGQPLPAPQFVTRHLAAAEPSPMGVMP